MRYYCDVIDEMRISIKTLRFDVLPGLIEELQTMGSRMENGLYDKENYESLKDDIHDLKNQKKKLERDIKKLTEDKEDLESK